MIKKVLITGATGNIGSYAIPQLIKEGVSVRAYVHNKAHAEKINLQGVEIIEGDYLNNEALEKAAKGTDAVVSITAANPDAVATGISNNQCCKTCRSEASCEDFSYKSRQRCSYRKRETAF